MKCGGRGFHAARRRAGIGAAPTQAWPRTSSDVWAVDDPAPLRRARGRYFPRDGTAFRCFSENAQAGLNSHLLVGRDRPRPRERDASFTSCTRFQMVSETMRGAVEVITLLGEATALTLPFFRAWPVPLYHRCRSCSRRD